MHEELLATINQLDGVMASEFDKYPKLFAKIVDVLNDLFDVYKCNAMEVVSKPMPYQNTYVNTDHPDFINAIVRFDGY